MSLASAKIMQGADNPGLTAGHIVATDESRLGKIYFLRASAKAATADQKAEDCLQAVQWLEKSLSAVEFLKDHPTPGRDDSGWLAEIQNEMAECHR